MVRVGEQLEAEPVLLGELGLSGLIPTITVSPTSPSTSLSPHACFVQPGVSAFG
jgi:hypothetical protein